MNLDELKTAWPEYDRKLQSTQAIHEKIITSMIADRSRVTWTKVRRYYTFGFISASIWLLLGAAVLIGNPFDYKHILQFPPITIMSICFLIFLIMFVINYRALSTMDINHDNLDVSLKKIIQLYEKPRKLLYGVLYSYFAAAFSFPLSFLPPKIDHVGFLNALGDTMIPMIIGLAIVLIAAKLGALRERYKDKFKNDLTELQELRSMSEELSS